MYLRVSPFDRNIHSQISICFAQVQRVIVLETKSILSKRTLPGFIKLIPWMFRTAPLPVSRQCSLSRRKKREVSNQSFSIPLSTTVSCLHDCTSLSRAEDHCTPASLLGTVNGGTEQGLESVPTRWCLPLAARPRPSLLPLLDRENLVIITRALSSLVLRL